MAIQKLPAPDFLPSKKERKDLDWTKRLYIKNLEIKAAKSVCEKTVEEREETGPDPDDYRYVPVTHQRLTDFGKQYILENGELYWQIPEEFRTLEMREEMIIYRPDLLRVKGFEVSDKALVAAILGPIPKDIPLDKKKEIQDARNALLSEGILFETEKGYARDYVFDYCKGMDVVPDSVKQWLQATDKGHEEMVIRNFIREGIQEWSNYYARNYQWACKCYAMIYSEKQLHEIEKKYFTEELKKRDIKDFHPFFIERMKSIGIEVPQSYKTISQKQLLEEMVKTVKDSFEQLAELYDIKDFDTSILYHPETRELLYCMPGHQNLSFKIGELNPNGTLGDHIGREKFDQEFAKMEALERSLAD